MCTWPCAQAARFQEAKIKYLEEELESKSKVGARASVPCGPAAAAVTAAGAVL